MADVLRVLDATDADGHQEWLRRWRAWPEREPMAHPAYVKLFAGPADRAVCAVAGDEAAGILYPLVLRPLASEPWAGPGESRWDATTPYGYGGPFAWGDASGLADPFWAQLEAWFRERRVVSSFARLSLFPEQLVEFRGEVGVNMPNVVRRLDLSVEQVWRDYAHKVRKNVNTARRANLSVELDPTGGRLDDFLQIYEATMDRRNAADGFYFSRTFFETILREMSGSFLFAHVRHGDRVVSTELVLRSSRRIYSFLGGTLEEAFGMRPNDLLKHSIIEWGIGEGLSAFVLGGGFGGPDGVFKYKLSFAPQGEVSFRVGRAIHDEAGYAQLVEARRAHEGRSGTWAPRESFFPSYRA
jgi:hypothetical protein